MSFQERRKTKILLEYWETLRRGRPFPREEEIDADALRALWDDCFLIQRRDILNVPQYNYTYMGKNIVRAYEQGELSGVIPGLAAMDAAHLAAEYRTVIETGKPMEKDGDHTVGGAVVLRYRQCLVPLGNERGDITAILGVMGFKAWRAGGRK